MVAAFCSPCVARTYACHRLHDIRNTDAVNLCTICKSHVGIARCDYLIFIYTGSSVETICRHRRCQVRRYSLRRCARLDIHVVTFQQVGNRHRHIAITGQGTHWYCRCILIDWCNRNLSQIYRILFVCTENIHRVTTCQTITLLYCMGESMLHSVISSFPVKCQQSVVGIVHLCGIETESRL